MGIMKLILALFQGVVLIGITLLVLYVVSSNFNIFGGLQPYVVQSGSMEPSIMTGDVVVIHEKAEYVLNDVITFRDNSNHIITHRIVSVEHDNGTTYATKGDANRTGDKEVIQGDQIIGAVALVIPKLGFIVAFAKSKYGLLSLIFIPAIVFITDELIKIIKNVRKRN